MNAELKRALKSLQSVSQGEVISSIKLLNGEIVRGKIHKIDEETITIQKEPQGGVGTILVIPYASILYVADTDLE